MTRRKINRPTLIVVDSHITLGLPNKPDTHRAHSASIREEEIKATKKLCGLPPDKTFHVQLPVYPADKSGMASHISNIKIMQAGVEACPYFVGGSADFAIVHQDPPQGCHLWQLHTSSVWLRILR